MNKLQRIVEWVNAHDLGYVACVEGDVVVVRALMRDLRSVSISLAMYLHLLHLQRVFGLYL